MNLTTIILDLDHCLIYSSYSELSELPLKGRKGYLYLYHRPGLNELIDVLEKAKNVTILFYTSSKADYARWVIKSMNVKFNYQLFSRSKTTKKYTSTGEVYLKSLSNINVSSTDNITVLDDRPDLWDDNGVRFIPIDPWHGEPENSQLSKVKIHLYKAIHQHNKRNINPNF